MSITFEREGLHKCYLLRIAEFMINRKIFSLVPELGQSLCKATAFAFGLECLKLIPPYLMKESLDLLLIPDPNINQVLTVISLVLVASFTTTLVEVRYMRFTGHSIFAVETSLLRSAHEKLLSLDLAYHESQPSGKVEHMLTNGAARLKELLWFLQDQFLGAILQIIVTSALLFWANARAALVFMFFIPPTVVLVFRAAKRLQPYRRIYHQTFSDATWTLSQSITHVRTVKDFVQEQTEQRRLTDILGKYQDLANTRIDVESRSILIRDFVIGFGRFSVLFYGVYLVAMGSMTAGTFVLFATLSEKVIASLYRLGRLYSHLGDSMVDVNELCELFATEPKVSDKAGAVAAPAFNGEIRFRDVSFGYTPELPILREIDIVIPERTVCAFVGRSGAGKSTMVKLLLRHYDVTNGAIEIDGRDLRDFTLSSYRQRIAVVSQDVEIFDSTIHDNIAYGQDASRAAVEAAAREAFAYDFVMQLPKGFDTRVGERGIKLSGGQKQRIGIARALIMCPSILIFDEATSALDSESERMIQQALTRISHLQTMIIIAHRLSTIEHADQIIVLDDGRVVEAGSQEELMAQRGVFHAMRRLQALGAIRE